jgi:GNAT superfamily N-acetyltransferase
MISPCGWVVCGDDGHKSFRCQRGKVNVVSLISIPHDPDVGRAPLQSRQDIDGEAVVQFDLDVWAAAGEFTDPFADDRGRGGDEGDIQATGLATSDTAGLVEVGRQAAQKVPRPWLKRRSCVCEADASRGPPEQLNVDDLLELPDLLGQGGLSDVQPLGGTAEVEFLGHSQKVPQVAELDSLIHSSSLLIWATARIGHMGMWDRRLAGNYTRRETRLMPHTSAPTVVSSIASQCDADAFRALNEEWISRLFTLQEEDRAVLGDPFGRIVGPGGDVLLARERGSGAAVGCVALLAYPDAVFELAKMAVAPAAQGRGIGRQLVAAAIDRAQALGAARLFLGTNSKLAPAIRLYEEAGFVRITRSRLPVADYYARADILMELR